MKPAQSRRRDRGSAAVEFALVLPILMLLIFALVDFGRMLSAKITVTGAAREGARAAAIIGPEEGASRVRAASGDLGEAVTSDVVGCPDPDTDPDADPENTDATVTVTYHFTFVTPVGLIFSDDHVDLVSRGVMPCLG